MVQVDDGLRWEVLRAVLEVRRINSPEIAYAAALQRTNDLLDQLEQVVFRRHDRSMMERAQAVHRITSLAGGTIIQVLMTNFCLDFLDAFGHLYFAEQAVYDALAKKREATPGGRSSPGMGPKT